jgi:hypothetical protein
LRQWRRNSTSFCSSTATSRSAWTCWRSHLRCCQLHAAATSRRSASWEQAMQPLFQPLLTLIHKKMQEMLEIANLCKLSASDYSYKERFKNVKKSQYCHIMCKL